MAAPLHKEKGAPPAGSDYGLELYQYVIQKARTLLIYTFIVETTIFRLACMYAHNTHI